MPLFKEEDIAPITQDIDFSETSYEIKKSLKQDEKKYIPDQIQVEEVALSIDFHPDQKLIAIGSVDGQSYLYRFSLDENEKVAVFQQHVESCREVCFSDNGKHLLSVSSDRSINSINIAKEKMSFEITNAHKYPINTFIVCDDNVIATGDEEGYVRVWDIRQGGKPVKEFEEHAECVTDFDFEPEDRNLYSTSADGTLCIMDLRKMKLVDITKQFQMDFLSVSDSTRGSLIGCGTSKGEIVVFEYGRWDEPIHHMKTSMNSVDTMCFLTDKSIAAGSSDGTIQVLSFQSKKIYATVCKGDDPIHKLALDPTGSYLASCGATDTVKFWNASAFYGQSLATRVEQQEQSEQQQDDAPETTTASASEEASSESNNNNKKRKRNVERVDTRKKKKVYNNPTKAFFHDLLNEY